MSRCGVVFLAVICFVQIGNFARANQNGIDNQKTAEETQLQAPIRRSYEPVECYDCVNCLQTNKDTPKKICPYHFDPSKAKTCVKYAEKYPQRKGGMNTAWVIRGCAAERGSCADITIAYASNDTELVELVHCSECKGNKCNSVSRSLPNFIFGFFAVVIAPILAKYTLS